MNNVSVDVYATHATNELRFFLKIYSYIEFEVKYNKFDLTIPDLRLIC